MEEINVTLDREDYLLLTTSLNRRLREDNLERGMKKRIYDLKKKLHLARFPHANEKQWETQYPSVYVDITPD